MNFSYAGPLENALQEALLSNEINHVVEILEKNVNVNLELFHYYLQLANYGDFVIHVLP